MDRRTVQAPDGRRWVVRRRWAPRLGDETLWARAWRKYRGTIHRVFEHASGGCVDDLGEGIVALLIGLVVLALLIFVVFPLVVVVVDLVILVLITLVGLAARVVFRRPWTVQARGDDGTVHRWKVVGWRASRQHRDDIADQLAAGLTPAPDTPTPGADVIR
jgi:hypothetical protein